MTKLHHPVIQSDTTSAPQLADHPTAILTVARAVRYLCYRDLDRASERNGVGYTGFDSQLGHRLHTSMGRWQAGDVAKASDLAARYASRQLRAAGIVLPLAGTVAAECADYDLLATANAAMAGTVYFAVSSTGQPVVAVAAPYRANLLPWYRAVQAACGGGWNRAAGRWEYLYTLACYKLVVATFADFDLADLVCDEPNS